MNAVFILWLRQLKRYVRSRARMIGSLGQPTLFLLALGFGLVTLMRPLLIRPHQPRIPRHIGDKDRAAADTGGVFRPRAKYRRHPRRRADALAFLTVTCLASRLGAGRDLRSFRGERDNGNCPKWYKRAAVPAN